MSAELLQEVSEHIAESRCREALARLSLLSDADLRGFTDAQLEELFNLLKAAALGLEVPQEQIKICELLDAIGEVLIHRAVSLVSLNLEIASAMFNRAVLLEQSGRPPDAVSTYTQFVNRHSQAKDLALGRLIAGAMVSHGLCLASMNLNTEAIEVYGRVDTLFSDSNDPVIRKRVARALNLSGVLMNKMNRLEEAIERYEEVQRRFSDDRDIAVLERVGVSMTNKAIVLFRQGRDKEAIEICKTVLSRYGNEPGLWNPTSVALNEIGYMALCEAKQLKAAGDAHKAEEGLRHAEELLSDAVNRRSQEPDPIILGNLGYVRFLNGDKEEARRVLTQAIALGGEHVRNVELRDSEISPLPEDVAFRELLRTL